MTRGQLDAIHVGGTIGAWHDLGFAGDDAITIGSTRIQCGAGTTGVPAASIRGVDDLDGLTLRTVATDGSPVPPSHPNGVTAIDHIVVLTPDPNRTTVAFEQQGLEARRVRRIEGRDGARRQTFFWLGDVICEVVGPDDSNGGDGPAEWWGLALTVDDIDATAEAHGEHLGRVKPAVQPGRRVTTVQRSAGLPLPIMFISPHPRGAGS